MFTLVTPLEILLAAAAAFVLWRLLASTLAEIAYRRRLAARSARVIEDVLWARHREADYELAARLRSARHQRAVAAGGHSVSVAEQP